MKINILYEDNHLLVLNKPAEIATMGAKPGEPSLIYDAKEYIKKKYNKPGNVFLGVVSRLDSFVSGVIVFARTSKAAKRLNEQFANHTTEKKYRLLIEKGLHPASGTWEDYLLKDDLHRRMRTVSAKTPGARKGILHYKTLRDHGKFKLIEVYLETGRKHQIRAQFSEHGFPIIGDRKYDSPRKWPVGIALHSQSLTIAHPISKEAMTFTAPLPDAWQT